MKEITIRVKDKENGDKLTTLFNDLEKAGVKNALMISPRIGIISGNYDGDLKIVNDIDNVESVRYSGKHFAL